MPVTLRRAVCVTHEWQGQSRECAVTSRRTSRTVEGRESRRRDIATLRTVPTLEDASSAWPKSCNGPVTVIVTAMMGQAKGILRAHFSALSDHSSSGCPVVKVCPKSQTFLKWQLVTSQPQGAPRRYPGLVGRQHPATRWCCRSGRSCRCPGARTRWRSSGVPPAMGALPPVPASKAHLRRRHHHLLHHRHLHHHHRSSSSRCRQRA